MKQTALQVVKPFGLDELVFRLGIKPENFPHSLSDCFEMKKEERKLLTKKLSGLSRVMAGIIPEQIDMKINNVSQFISYLFEKEKIQKSAAYNVSPDTVIEGFGKAIAFLIIRDHHEAEAYPELMEMRKAIEATKQVHRATARGSHKGGNAEEIQDAVDEMIASKNIIMLTRNQFLPFLEIASKLSLLGDKKAKLALLNYHEIKQEVVNG